MKKKLLIIISSLLVKAASAQEFQTGAEFRPRFEYRNGFGQLRAINDSLDNAASFTSQRSRLWFNYSNLGQKIKLGAVLQDVRTWGTTEQLNIGDKNNFSIHQFWGELYFSDKFSFKAGRQEFNYDNARILGDVDWAQQARSFDAGLLKYETAGFKLHAAFGLNTKSETLTAESYDNANYKSLQFLWLNKTFKNTKASLLFLNNGIEFTKDPAKPPIYKNRDVAFSQTLGGRIEFQKNKFGFNTEGYFQGGKNNVNRKLEAFDLTAEVFVKPGKPVTVLAGNEWISGTATDRTGGKSSSFNPLYGTNHKFNGTMDYFFVGGRWNNKVGLIDSYVSLKYAGTRFKTDLTAHAFNAYADVFSAGENLDKYLGLETDLSGGYKISELASVQAGFSVLSGSKTLQFLTAGTDKSKLNTWGWAQLTLKPVFFTSSN